MARTQADWFDIDTWVQAWSDRTIVRHVLHDARPSITDSHRVEIAKAIDGCRVPARRGSSDSALPPDAGARAAAAMSGLLMSVAVAALIAIRDEPLPSSTHKRQLRIANDALKRVHRAQELIKDLHGSEVANFGGVALRLGHATGALQALDESLLSLVERIQDAPALKHRPPLSWRRAALVIIGLWWCEQGWQPTSTPDGAYLTTVRIVEGFYRKGVEDHPDFNKTAVLSAIRQARALRAAGIKANIELEGVTPSDYDPID